MFLIRVIPIVRGKYLGELSFFSRSFMPEGSIVKAPVRKRSVSALVVACSDVREKKLDLKAQGYALKKLTAEGKPVLRGEFVRALKRLAHYYVAHDGATIATLTFASLLDTPRSLPDVREYADAPTAQSPDTTPDVLVLQADPEGRISAYKNLSRECFARGTSVLIIASSLIEVEWLARELSRGIEEQVLVLSSAETPKQLRAAWTKAVTSPLPVLVIGTPPALSVPLPRLDTIVVERESARNYMTRLEPHLDLRKAAEYVARERGARLMLADYPLRVETRARVDVHTAEEAARPQVRQSGTTEVVVVDNRKSDATKRERRTFTPLAPSTLETLAAVLEKKGHAAVFAARTGIAPLTVCNDCGTPVTDPTTGAPMTLIKTPQGNVFISRRTGAIIPSHTTCRVCGSWNLATVGIGVDRVYDALKKEFPKTPILLFTQDTTPTHRAATKLMQDFYSQPALIVGTERMLPYIRTPIEVAAVASIDSLLSLPAWRASEHALSILAHLRAMARDTLIIETRKPDNEVLRAMSTGNIIDFYRSEITEREQYGYPPFSLFISLTWQGSESVLATLRASVLALKPDYDMVGPLPPEIIDRGRETQRAVLRLDPSAWPNEALYERLKELPPEISVTVDPDDIV